MPLTLAMSTPSLLEQDPKDSLEKYASSAVDGFIAHQTQLFLVWELAKSFICRSILMTMPQ